MKQFLTKGATLRSLVKTPSRGLHFRHAVQRGGQSRAFLLASSMMLIGGTSYMLYNNFQTFSLTAVAEAEA
jgi:hypothetical protein